MRTAEHTLFDSRGERDGTCTVLPDLDIALLGKARQGTIVWICGDFVEEILTTSLWISGLVSDVVESQKTPLADKEITRRCATRAQKNVRRLVNTNKFRFMWTLTFRLPNPGKGPLKDETIPLWAQKDYDAIRKLWKGFLRKLYASFGRFTWLVVFELHNSAKTSGKKRGTYHIHFACNERLAWSEVGRLWGHGFVRFDDFLKHSSTRKTVVHNPGAYLSKYIGKAFNSENRHRKRFSCSSGIKRPKKVSGAEFDRIAKERGWVLSEVFRREQIFESKNQIYGTLARTHQILVQRNRNDL